MSEELKPFSTPYWDLLTELRRRELAVIEQQNRVNRFELELFRNANMEPEREAPPKRKRNGNQFVPGFVIDALNELPVEMIHRNGKVKLPTK